MKRPIVFTIVIALLLSLVACSGQAEPVDAQPTPAAAETPAPQPGESGSAPADDPYAELETYTIKMIATSLEGEEPTPEIQAVCAEIEERTGGKLKFDLTIGGSTLFGESEMYDMLRSGSVDMINCATTQYSDIMPEMSIACWPYVFENTDQLNAFWTGAESQYIYDYIRDNSSTVLLTVGFTGVRNLTTKGIEVRTPADLNGVKIRCMDSAIYVEGTNAMGATAVPIAWSELYFALQTGVVQGQENANTVIEAGSLYEVQDTICLTEHLYSMSAFGANADFWNGLPEPYQEVIRTTLVEHFNGDFADRIQQQNAELLQGFATNYGMKIIEDVDKQAFIEACGAAFQERYGNDAAWMRLYNAIKAAG